MSKNLIEKELDSMWVYVAAKWQYVASKMIKTVRM